MNDVILEVQNIDKSFAGVHALADVSLSLRAGEVHAVIGENGAGKSTLMNIVSGKLAPDRGTLLRKGSAVTFANPRDAQRQGIAIAPQEINLVPGLSIFENIALGAQAGGGLGLINWRRTREAAISILHQIDDSIDPDCKAGQLSKAEQQLVQIARAVSTSAEILIFDEPTAALTARETERLFAFIRRFRENGNSIFYISHRLEEILALSQRITCLRDGCLVAELDTASTTKDEMVRHMAGRIVKPAPHRPPGSLPQETVLDVKRLTRKGEFADISFDLRRGEIVGIAGLIGSGRTELGKCLFGLKVADSGDVTVFGERVRLRHPADAIAKGLVYLPEERKQEGIFALLSISENMTISVFDRFRGFFGLRFPDMLREVETFVDRLKIKIGRPEDAITTLSGGNQQKVIIARWLLKNSRVLILDEPTRGIDVNAKAEIQGVLRDLTGSGLSIIYISSELQEVIDVSDRIVVMHEGRIRGTVNAAEATQESLLAIAMS
ncbi:ABC-type sugar transport system ATPase subunit [Pararhizobium capsulatum DSM 1112]|uniref:ABC-type sugar transport system ATPase subunit n=1 Tax=Pararhizobium capsulatum DSM 1112 TaxID=1121113 RepID=A0ABU0C1F8_9HYPH|nr:sugar ABC transporter ATP-binding protein [Pararhizobium capsulatum]MDQ0323736.1 ABC-type sugar transport system ATPase subunit [Pararhizobium capsulatum DSM 1112]